jgi:ATP-binding cassette subfamily B protein
MKTDSKATIRQIFKEFWRGIRPSKWLFFISLFCFIFALIVGVFVPIYYKKFFDLLGSTGTKVLVAPTLVKILIVIAILNFTNWIFYRSGMYVFNAFEAKVMARLKQNAFDYMMLHSYSFFANNFSGSLVQRVNRFSRSFERLADSLVFNIIPLIITVLGSVIVTFFMAPMISLVILGWVVFFSLFNFLFSQWKQKYNEAVALADSQTTGVLADDITNHNAVTLFTAYESESKYYKQITDDQAKKTLLSWNLSEVVSGVQSLLISIVEFVVFYYTVSFWQEGVATIGTFVMVQVYVIGVAQQLWGLNRIMRNIYEGIADSKEMVEILTTPYEIKDLPDAEKLAVNLGAIEFKNVGFNFNETREVLNGVDVRINSGEKIALVGPSGAGKTTFVRLILRLYDLVKGEILIDGQNIKNVTQESLHESISLVPQDPVLFHRTLMENIRYGRREATDGEVVAAAKLAHCDEFIDNLPLKYETFVGERGVKLSGGERQRVAIARAILKNAPILILDEATSSLDSHSEALIQDALETLMKGKTVIVIAHRLSTIRKMDRILVMKDGNIAEEGTHQDLIKMDGGIYQNLWNLQVSGFIQEAVN